MACFVSFLLLVFMGDLLVCFGVLSCLLVTCLLGCFLCCWMGWCGCRCVLNWIDEFGLVIGLGLGLF